MNLFGMETYERMVRQEIASWQSEIRRGPSLISQLSQGLQERLNKFIPEKAHQVITAAIKQMVRAVLFGSEFISGEPLSDLPLEQREVLVRERIGRYKKMAAASGFSTGTGGFLLSLADFPILLSLKMKLLFDLAGLYGFNVKNYQERVFILYVFQLAFSSPEIRMLTYERVIGWEDYRKELPADINEFDWRTFQQEYRDVIDLAKMLQMVPGFGAIVGAYANHRLVDKLGVTAMNSFRLRLFATKRIDGPPSYN
jgi:hypothetical protein